MIQQMLGFFVSFFADPSVWGVGLAVVFGAVWLITYRPPLFRKPWLWVVLPASAIITLIAVAFIQIPLRHLLSQEIVLRRLLLAGVPVLLLGGVVQEGAKLVPVVAWWWRKGKNIDPKLGVAIGATAGVGFGIFEAQWIHNHIFASGWSWETVQATGGVGLPSVPCELCCLGRGACRPGTSVAPGDPDCGCSHDDVYGLLPYYCGERTVLYAFLLAADGGVDRIVRHRSPGA